MSKFDEVMADYKALASKMGLNGDDPLLAAVAKGLGPSIYNNDSSRVSCSDGEELERVKQNFLLKKLGLADSPDLMAAIKSVCEHMGSGNRDKYRAVFYYALVKHFKKEDVYG